jgi:glycosyltransferase involved in cell wall biosynthesis
MKQSRKIAYFMTNIGFRGGVVGVYFTLKHLDRTAYEPIFMTCSDGEPVERISELGVKCYVFPIPIEVLNIGRNRLWRGIFKQCVHVFAVVRVIFQMVRFVRREKVDLIHTQDQKSSILGGVIGFLSRVPVVWHVNDIPEGMTSFLDQFFGLLFAKKIIAVSGAVAKPFKNNPLLRRKLRIISNGVDLSIFNPDVKGDRFRSEQQIDGRVVGQVSALIPLKGIQYFIEAAHRLLNSQHRITFFVIGDNPVAQYKGFENELKREVSELGIEGKFRFLDFRHNIAEAMAAFDVFVFPSTGDGFGRVLIEAAAMKIPIVACDVGASREILENGRTALLVPPRDSESLAHAIDKLLTDGELRRSVTKAGYQKVLDVYDIKRVAAKIEKTYQDVFDGN